MNEHEMERIFVVYRDGLGACRRPPIRRRTPYPLRWACAAGAMVVLAGGLSLIPSNAGANALRRVEGALANARTMEMVFETQRPSGKWVVFDRERYSEGRWRYDVEKGRGQRVTSVVRGGLEQREYERLDHATLAPVDQDSVVERPTMTALEYAKSLVDTGKVSTPREIRLVHRGATDVIVLDRAEDRYHAEIVVDPKTDLPISAEVSVDYGPQGGGINRYRQTYRFNRPMPNALFAPPADKPLIDLRKAQPLLAQKWATPLARVGETTIRDACVTSDGTVWTVVSGDFDGSADLPSDLIAPGFETVRLMDVDPGAYGSRELPFRIEGEDVAVVGFVPLEPMDRPGASVQLGFARRKADWPGFAPPEDRSEIPAGRSVGLALRKIDREVPDYFAALDLDRFSLEVPLHCWNRRAEALEKEGRLLSAARAYERCAEAYRDFVVYAGYRPLLKAATCYDRLAMPQEAQRVRAEAYALEATRER